MELTKSESGSCQGARSETTKDGISQVEGQLLVFFFARSCLGKVPGRAPFSQLSKRATACTIRMQIVKQFNETKTNQTSRNSSCNVLVKQTNLLTSILLGDDFFGRHAAKKTGNVDPKMGPKIWTPFWGPRKEKTIRRTPKRGPDFAPHFRVHIAHYFSRSDAGKITFWIECL